jgi:hypothetical protein
MTAMKIRFAIALLSMVLLIPAAHAAADPAPAGVPTGVDPKLAADIHTLLEISGSGKLSDQILDQIIGMVRQQYPAAPAEFWTDFRKESPSSEYLDQIIPIYASHFTDEEVQEMIRFYRSPVGQKLVKEQPLMMRESKNIGQKWGFAVSERIRQRLRERGYLKN